MNLYERPLDANEPVLCVDEKSKQLLADTRKGFACAPAKTAVQDYEYKRQGTRNIFVAVQPRAGKHITQVTKKRKKEDYAHFIADLVGHYPDAQSIHIVQDNLSTHTVGALIHTFGDLKAEALMKRIQFHYTPKHASWLNMAEIEIGILDKQCLNRRIPTAESMHKEVQAWTERRNKNKSTIDWTFTKKKAEKVFPELYAES